MIVSGPDAWGEAARIQFAKGADVIKRASEYTQEEIAAAVDEAHSLGLPVTVDAETQYIGMAIKAGVDSIEHPLPRSDEAIALMAKRSIASVPTLIPYRLVYGNPDEDFNAFRKVRTAFVGGRRMLQDGRLYKPAHEEVPLPERKPQQ